MPYEILAGLILKKSKSTNNLHNGLPGSHAEFQLNTCKRCGGHRQACVRACLRVGCMWVCMRAYTCVCVHMYVRVCMRVDGGQTDRKTVFYNKDRCILQTDLEWQTLPASARNFTITLPDNDTYCDYLFGMSTETNDSSSGIVWSTCVYDDKEGQYSLWCVHSDSINFLSYVILLYCFNMFF